MAKPATRSEFKDYCLRKLGAPVIHIDLDDNQIEDRIDEALDFWRDYHFDGTELVYLKHQISQQDVNDGYLTIPQKYVGVVRIFNFSPSLSSSNMFSFEYQYLLNNAHQITSGGLSDYVIMRQYLTQISEILNGQPMIRFNRLNNKLHLDMSKEKLVVGQYIIIEAYDGIDSEDNPEVWGDRWLQNYAAVLIKENWSSVLTKFTGAQLVSGMTFNGEMMLSDAKEERRKLEEEVTKNFGPVMHYYIG